MSECLPTRVSPARQQHPGKAWQTWWTQPGAGGVDIVLCRSISRLAGNTIDLLATVRELKDLDVAARFEREHIDTLSADGELLLTLLAPFAQEESRSLSHNVK